MDERTYKRFSELLRDYNEQSAIESTAKTKKGYIREEIMEMFKEAGTRAVEVDGYSLKAVSKISKSIPLELAKKVLEPSVLEQLVQERTSVMLSIKPLKAGKEVEEWPAILT